MSCGIGHRHGSDPELLWLWHRLVATAPIRTLAWESPDAKGAALEKAKRPKNLKIKKSNSQKNGNNSNVLQKVNGYLFGVPVVTQWLTNPTRNHEVVGSIPGLAQWVEDLALPWALVWVTDVVWIWHGYGCGVGWGL